MAMNRFSGAKLYCPAAGFASAQSNSGDPSHDRVVPKATSGFTLAKSFTDIPKNSGCAWLGTNWPGVETLCTTRPQPASSSTQMLSMTAPDPDRRRGQPTSPRLDRVPTISESVPQLRVTVPPSIICASHHNLPQKWQFLRAILPPRRHYPYPPGGYIPMLLIRCRLRLCVYDLPHLFVQCRLNTKARRLCAGLYLFLTTLILSDW